MDSPVKADRKEWLAVPTRSVAGKQAEPAVQAAIARPYSWAVAADPVDLGAASAVVVEVAVAHRPADAEVQAADAPVRRANNATMLEIPMRASKVRRPWRVCGD